MFHLVTPLRQCALQGIDTSLGIAHLSVPIDELLTDGIVGVGYLALKVGHLLFELDNPRPPTLIWLLIIAMPR